MTHSTSVFRRRRPPSARLSGAVLAWLTVLAAAIVVVVALALALCVAWLAGYAQDLYAGSNAGSGRAMPGLGTVSATIRRLRPASSDWRSGGTGPRRRSMACC